MYFFCNLFFFFCNLKPVITYFEQNYEFSYLLVFIYLFNHFLFCQLFFSPFSFPAGCLTSFIRQLASQVAPVVKKLPANAGDIRDPDLIPRSGRSPGGAHGNPLQYSCLENPMDRGALVGYSPWCWKSQIRLK